MPVSLSELRTLIADTVRVQRLQELQQAAVRTNQEALAGQFRDVLEVRKASVKGPDTTERTKITQDDESRSQARADEREGQPEAGAEEEPQDSPPALTGAPGLGGIIDLKG